MIHSLNLPTLLLTHQARVIIPATIIVKILTKITIHSTGIRVIPETLEIPRALILQPIIVECLRIVHHQDHLPLRTVMRAGIQAADRIASAFLTGLLAEREIPLTTE